MGEIFISKADNNLIESANRKGLGVVGTTYKWWVMRLALARSLQMESTPAQEFGRPPADDRGGELHLEQITGEGQGEDIDLTDTVRLLLSAHAGEDLFADRAKFIDHLQRHIRRGLSEIRASWREANDFHDYLYQELFFVSNPDRPNQAPEGSDLIEKGLKEIGVRAEIKGHEEGPRLTRFLLHLQDVNDLDRLRGGLERLQFSMGMADQALSLSTIAGEKMVALDVPRPRSRWKAVLAESVRAAVRGAEGELPVCPGADVLGKPAIFDFAEAPHLFVGGTTGSGKSVCLHSLILSLLTAKRAPQLALIDPKKLEFAGYSRLSDLYGGKVVTDAEEAAQLLADLVEEMDQRETQLAEMGVANIGEAQKKGSQMRRIVVVVEELADLLMQAPSTEDHLVRLAQKARASGIHLLLATQRPDAETFPGLLRTNVPSRIALSVRTASESRVILDETGAEDLLGNGDMLIKLIGNKTTRAHGALVKPSDVLGR